MHPTEGHVSLSIMRLLFKEETFLLRHIRLTRSRYWWIETDKQILQFTIAIMYLTPEYPPREGAGTTTHSVQSHRAIPSVVIETISPIQIILVAQISVGSVVPVRDTDPSAAVPLTSKAKECLSILPDIAGVDYRVVTIAHSIQLQNKI